MEAKNMNNLKFLINELELIIADKKLNHEVVTTSDGSLSHKISTPETTWPKVRPLNFEPISFSTPVIEDELTAKSLLREMLFSEESFKKCCKLLKTYDLPRNLSWLFEEVRDTYKLHKKHAHLFDTFTQDGSHIVEVFRVRLDAFMLHSQLAFTNRLTPSQSTVDQLGEHGMYQRAAVIAVPPAIPKDEVLEYVFTQTQNLDCSWEENPIIASLVGPGGATDVGDVFQMDGGADVVSGVGFKKLTMFFPRDPDAVFDASYLDRDGPEL
jgi:hypothetical protein